MGRTVIGSVARIAGFGDRPPGIDPRPRERWRNGDYVVCEMLDSGPPAYEIETPSGGYEELRPGDRIIGALGKRAATLQAVGDWEEVGDDGVLETLTAAGVLGRCTSIAVGLPPLAQLRYLGHAVRDGEACTMRGSVEPGPDLTLTAPVVLIIGTSMEAGKTIAARAMIRELKRMGARVAGAKLTGVGRYRDILAMRDAGADYIADFVDAGLPSTVTPPAEYREALAVLISKLAGSNPDAVIAEAGASPLEPYNGDVAVRSLADHVQATVLCASDPYAVIGVMHAFKAEPDLVAGRATSTEAGVALIEKLTGRPALNPLDPASGPKLASYLRDWLGPAAGADRSP
ncbi:MAG TPA: hypothetical protein VK919_03705 [Solirubrobacterales bacterium]|nr:hypothetical protein [Solirubrobacterales bacterium]